MAKNLVLNRSRKVPAEDTAAFGAIAERFRRAGALERAVELCREGLQKFPDHISARVTLGWSLLDLGKYDEARTELGQVLRRAPDNLAAIRGLAELHDRFEHTLHLPMDGPGQWPPPPETVDGAGTQVEASATHQNSADTDREMTPAALGIPIWSPAVSPTPEVEAPAARAASAPAPAAAPAVTPKTHSWPKAKAAKAKAKTKPTTAAPEAMAAPETTVAPETAAGPVTTAATDTTPAPETAPGPVTPAAADTTPAPETAAGPVTTAAADTTPAPETTAGPVTTAAIDTTPAPEMTVAAAAHTEPPPAVSEPVKLASPTSGSGMSSLREIDFSTAASVSVPTPAMEEPSAATDVSHDVRAETAVRAPDTCAVSDADIQALIAEADSLDAVVAMPAESETISLEAMALGAENPLSAVEEVASPPAPAVLYSSVTEPISVDFDLDAASPDIDERDLTIEVVGAEAAAEFAPQQVSASAPVSESTLEAEHVFEEALEIAAPLIEGALQIEEPVVAAIAPVEPAVEAVLQAEAEQVFEDALEIAAPIVEAALEIQPPVLAGHLPPAAVDVSSAPEPAAKIDLVSEIEIAAAPAIEAWVAAEVVELAPVAAVAEVVSIETGRTAPRSPVPALERLLTKVQARRAQLMAESVA